MRSIRDALRGIARGLDSPDAEADAIIEHIKSGNWTSGATPHITATGVHFYWDVQTGKDPTRIGFDALVNEIMSDAVSHLIIWHRNRFMRASQQTEELEGLIWEMNRMLSTTLNWHDVELWEEGQRQITEGMVGRVVTSIKTESELLESSEREFRFRDGRRQSFLAGTYAGSRLNWWHTTQNLKARELTHLEGLDFEAAKVRAYEMGYIQNKLIYIDQEHIELFEELIAPFIESSSPSEQDVANFCNEQGISSTTWRTRKPHKWVRSSVQALFDRHAQGIYKFHDVDADKDLYTLPEVAERLRIKSLPPERCEHFLRILELNRKVPYKPRRDRQGNWLLDRGRLRCYNCGSPMLSRSGGHAGKCKHYYACVNRCRQGGRTTLTKSDVQASFCDELKTQLFAGELMQAFKKEVEKYEKGNQPDKQRLTMLKKNVKSIQQENTRIGQRIGRLTDQAFEAATGVLAANKSRLVEMEQEVARLESLADQKPIMPAESYFSWISKQLKSFDALPFEEKHAFVRQVVAWCSFDPEAGPDDAWYIEWSSVIPKITTG